MQKDEIFKTKLANIKDFSFDEAVASVFPDMIKRSVPGYLEIIHSIGKLATKFVTANSNVYDLGCSQGAVSLELRRNINNLEQKQGIKIIAVDNSEAMLKRCQENVFNYQSDIEIELILDDICNIELKNASMVVLNFTLQFLSPENRQKLIDKIYQALNPNGILILSEKIKFDDQNLNENIIWLHHEFKKINGYSELEISQKRQAIENVMKIDSYSTHLKRLEQAGFVAQCYFQKYNFCSFIALKK